jgi:peroxiredoxin
MKFPFPAIFAVVLFALSACSSGEKATGFITENAPAPASAKQKDGDVPRDSYGRPFQYTLLGQRIPEFELPLLNGGTVSSADLAGSWTVVEIWGLWCPDCVVDGPNVQRLVAELEKDPEIGFLSIHSPPSASRRDEAFGKYASLDAYFKATGGGYPVAVDADGAVKDKFSLPWVPMYMLVDPDRVIRGFRTEFSAAGENPVETFLSDIRAVTGAG